MKFEHRCIFSDLNSVWSICIDQAFMIEAYDLAGADVTWLEHDIDGSKARVVCEVVYRNRLPMVAAKLLKRDHLTYELIQEVNTQTKTVNWRLRVRGSGSKATAIGTIQFEAHSEGCERVFNCVVTVDVPIIGKRIEKEAIRRLQSVQDDLCALLLKRCNSEDIKKGPR